MKYYLLLAAALLCLGEAKRVTTIEGGANPFIIGGSDSVAGAWPWMLSLELNSGSWEHACGAALLSGTKAITVGHCVDGRTASSLRVVAGLLDRNNYAGTVMSTLASYRVHEDYNNGAATYANDVALLTLQTAINPGANIGYAQLPPNNNDDFAGDIGAILGWGRTSSSPDLSDILQEAHGSIVDSSFCQFRMEGIASVWVNQICVYEQTNNIGLCNGDSGGPMNCPIIGGGYYVCGLISFGVSSGSDCDTSYPTVGTRVGSYLTWINNNMDQ